jgi:predicted transcriptional regulator
MVSDKLMKECLTAMSGESISLRELCRRMDRNDSNVRRTLLAMENLGMVRRTSPEDNGKGTGRYPRKWEKLVSI